MAFELPPLPYPKDGLEPHISAETLDFHHGKHHAAYVKKLNGFVESDKNLQGRSLEEIIKSSSGGVFNNAAQVWNHTFFWNSMRPNGGGQPQGYLAEAINKAFGSFDKFKEEFNNAAVNRFASGWAWLVAKADGSVSIVTTPNAETPLTDDSLTALLTCDVWEHAYYIDYRNDRAAFLSKWWNLVNWEFAQQNYDQRSNR